jgi:hypothetical protein
MEWRRVDLHIHTPASTDYRQANVSPLDILRVAEERGLDVIALTDHNSVRGYADMWREIEDLELLEYLGRLKDDERKRLDEYRRLLASMLVLPGFEFTATFGFHVLAIFPEGTTVRLMEHLLLTLGVPEEKFGSGEVGATTDVLRAYRVLDDHGALVIGAHVNSTHGIAMQGFAFGGQTKIAYTQDPHLHALEVTDLHIPANRRSTARFFNGTKPEYPRRMHCIQGSDAHRLERDPDREANLGVGDRVTEMLLPEFSFRAIKALLTSHDFDRTRRYVAVETPAEILKAAREDKSAAFHERPATKRDGQTPILRDLVAMANAEGGTVYIGASANARRPIAGIANVDEALVEVIEALAAQVSPALAVEAEHIDVDDRTVIGLHVQAGKHPPYALAPGMIYVRDGNETRLATRDEIIAMVRAGDGELSRPLEQAPTVQQRSGRRRRRGSGTTTPSPPVSPNGHERAESAPTVDEPRAEAPPSRPALPANTVEVAREDEWSEPALPDSIAPPSGVEILESRAVGGSIRFTLNDLRNRLVVHNVGRDTHRRMWRYAIEQFEHKPIDESRVRWKGPYGFWRTYNPRGGDRRYNVVYRDGASLRVFYGVSDDGLPDAWRAVLPAPRRKAPAKT